MSTPSDEKLLADIRLGGTGCDRALRYLYETHLPMVIAYITRNNGTREDAEDKFQNAIVAFYEHVRDDLFQGRSSVKSYVYAIARKMWLTELRRRNLGEAYVAAEMNAAVDLPDTPEALLLHEEQNLTLDRLMNRLGEGCRTALRWRFWHAKPFKEVAQLLGLKNEQVAKNKQAKCLETLRKLIMSDPEVVKVLEDLP
jgi:RNA polymerase sigma factor (sigma-70 family)